MADIAATDAKYTTFPADMLRTFAEKTFESFGIPHEDAWQAADILVAADLRGIDSHGIARLSNYFEQLSIGRINPNPNITVVRESASTATIDGDNGLGLVVGPHANNLAMDKADAAGSGWVAVRNTNHYGIAGYYPIAALKRDQIGFSMTNTTSVVAPLFGAERRLGTNPLAVAFPGLEEPPIVIDMATTSATFGRIENALRRNESIPEGWAVDAEGRTTTDPNKMVDGGALLPMGGDRLHGAHKGYCLSAMVDILSGPLGGANWGPFTPAFALMCVDPPRWVGKGIGHFFGSLRISAFIDPEEFKRQIDDWIRTFRSTKAAPGTDGPLIPGDPERKAEEIRRRDGIPLLQPVVDDLRSIAAKTGIKFD